MLEKKLAIPQHVAIMLDGNRRWARKRGLKPWEGHFEGIGKVAEEISRAVFDAGITYLTIWGGSYDNLTKRSKMEIRMLNEAYRQFAKRILQDKEVEERKVNVSFLGEWREVLEPKTIKLLKQVQSSTKSYKKHYLTLLIAYNGDREMLDAIRRIQKSKKRLTSSVFKSYLWTANMPPVDLLIRTGVEGDPHNSTGFMMWDVAYSQLYFTEKMWPDFNKKDFLTALKSYSSRERRLGK